MFLTVHKDIFLYDWSILQNKLHVLIFYKANKHMYWVIVLIKHNIKDKKKIIYSKIKNKKIFILFNTLYVDLTK